MADRDTAPWEVDPTDVDRYLEERALAQRPPSRGDLRTRPPRAESMPGSAARRAAPSHGATEQRRAARPTPRPSLGDPTDPAQWDDATDDAWVEPEPEVVEASDSPPVAPPVRRAAGQTRARGRAVRPPTRQMPNLPPMPQVRIPPFIAQSEIARDNAALWLLGISAFGLGVMAALMGNQLGGLDPGIGIHVDAAGRTDRWGEPTGLWRLPLLATMITLMNLVVAWFLARSDRFAARFLLAAAVVVQLVTWVAVVHFL